MPTLEWIGKDKVINHHQQVPYRVLEEKYTYNAEKSDNMIIRGDNLEALKALLPKYEGRIDCIYIDPPYNTANSTTQNQKWVYSDNVDDPKIQKWLYKVVGNEGEDLSRHDKWLCMMYPRLKLLRKLLSDTGVIFMSIDDNEYHSLRYLCDEIFGRNNYITTFAVENNPKGRKNNSFVSEGYEHCLLYVKDRYLLNLGKHERFFNDVSSGKEDTRGIYYDEYGVFKQSKRQVVGTNKSNALCINSKPERCFTVYYLKSNDTVIFLDEYDSDSDLWYLSTQGEELISKGYIRYTCNNSQNGRPSIPLYSKETFLEKHYNHMLFFKDDGTIYEKERDDGQQVTSFLPNKRFGIDLMTESATSMLEEIFGEKDKFPNSKNVNFIQMIVSLIKTKDAIILDSFAGSGTTAHAVLNMNKTDDGNRKFILVEMMDYAESITAERVKRVINGYGSGKQAVEGTGGDFAFYDLGQALLFPDGNLNEEVDTAKIREYIWYMETKTPLAEVVSENPYYLGENNDTGYYFFYEKERITRLGYEFLATIKEKSEGYLIYADLCTIPDEELKRYNITFKKIPQDIAKL